MDLMECLLSGVSNLVGEIDIEQISYKIEGENEDDDE